MGLSDKVYISGSICKMTVVMDYDVYYLGLQDIVALSGAHTLGRSRPERSGWGKPETKYTVGSTKY